MNYNFPHAVHFLLQTWTEIARLVLSSGNFHRRRTKLPLIQGWVPQSPLYATSHLEEYSLCSHLVTLPAESSATLHYDGCG